MAASLAGRPVFGDHLRDLRAFLECLHIGRISPLQDLSDVGKMDPDLLGAFETAFLGRHFIRFDYGDAKGRKTKRQVEPQAMLILSPLWYLVGWDPARQDFRHFRMDRISRPEVVLATSFRRRHVPFGNDVCPYTELHPERRSSHLWYMQHPTRWARSRPSPHVA